MDQYIARQPILNVSQKLYAYELLYRGRHGYTLDKVSGERATASLLSSTFLTQGIEKISRHRPCFINFTQDLLVKQLPAAFPKTQIVVEILEDVKPEKAVIEACRSLSEKGYTIALDDFVYDRTLEPLIELAHIIKIDVRLTPLDTILQTLNKLSRHNVKLLAEKVETRDEFDKACKLGFRYFQGYFFSRPEQLKVKELNAVKVNLINLLAEVSQKKTDINRLHKIMSVDIAMSYKLLRFLNSAYFYRLQKVKDVKHAIAYLGEKELRRFILLVLISELATEKPGELVRMALIRAKFCELLAEGSAFKQSSLEFFLMGLFSFLDSMLNVSMQEVTEKLPLSENVKNALLHNSGPFALFLNLATAYERNQDKTLTRLIRELNLQEDEVLQKYIIAVTYSNGLQ